MNSFYLKFLSCSEQYYFLCKKATCTKQHFRKVYSIKNEIANYYFVLITENISMYVAVVWSLSEAKSSQPRNKNPQLQHNKNLGPSDEVLPGCWRENKQHQSYTNMGGPQHQLLDPRGAELRLKHCENACFILFCKARAQISFRSDTK